MKLEYKWISVVVLAVVVGVVYVYFRQPQMSDKSSDQTADETASYVAQSVIESGVGARVGAVVVSGSANQTVKYTQLVKEYEGRRIQFDMTCQATPPNTTYKNNTKILFDNRSGDARVITIGGVQYNFPGYGYKVLNISGAKLPAKVSFDCGAAINVGSILIQK